MASKRALAIKREMLAKKQLSFNEQMGILLMAIAEKIGVDLDELLKAGHSPEPAELAEVTEPAPKKEEPKKKASRKRKAKKVVEPEPHVEDEELEDEELKLEEEGEGW